MSKRVRYSQEFHEERGHLDRALEKYRFLGSEPQNLRGEALACAVVMFNEPSETKTRVCSETRERLEWLSQRLGQCRPAILHLIRRPNKNN